MKFIIVLLLSTCGISSAFAQTNVSDPLFKYNGNSLVTQPKYIEPFYFEDQNTPHYLFKTYTISSKDKTYSYLVKLSNYKGAEDDGGYYRIIDIEAGGKNILSLKQSDGWNNLNTEVRQYASNDYFLTIPLTDTTTALLFVGYPYQSQPELLTIALLNKDKAELIFNKPFIINDIEQHQGENPAFVINLQDYPIEYLNESTPANTAKLYKIFQCDNILKFGGPYETVTK